MKKISLIGFSLIFVIVGIAVLIFGLRLLDKAQASENWPTAQGTILSAEIETKRERDSDTSYSAEITYEYPVGQDKIIGNRVRYVKTSTNSPSEASRDVNQYPKGKSVTVYYNPEDPYESVLEPGKNSSVWFLIILGVMFALVGSLFLVTGIFTKNQDIIVTTRVSSNLD